MDTLANIPGLAEDRIVQLMIRAEECKRHAAVAGIRLRVTLRSIRRRAKKLRERYSATEECDHSGGGAWEGEVN